MGFHTGLVSVSFRPRTVEEILEASRAAGLEWIEWGSDVHVPAGGEEKARFVAQATAAAGLRSEAYGSYFRIGVMPVAEFVAYRDTALWLGARVIRVWGGNKDSEALSGEDWDRLVADGRAIAEMAAQSGLTVTLECHGGTVTNRWESAMEYLRRTSHPALRMYWQPNQFRMPEYNREAAEKLAPWVENLHVFSWEASGRHPLAWGREDWRQYLEIFRPQARKREMGLLLEFMHDDRLESLAETADELHRWVAAL